MYNAHPIQLLTALGAIAGFISLGLVSLVISKGGLDVHNHDHSYLVQSSGETVTADSISNVIVVEGSPGWFNSERFDASISNSTGWSTGSGAAVRNDVSTAAQDYIYSNSTSDDTLLYSLSTTADRFYYLDFIFEEENGESSVCTVSVGGTAVGSLNTFTHVTAANTQYLRTDPFVATSSSTQITVAESGGSCNVHGFRAFELRPLA